MTEFKSVALGDRAKDTVTGLTGIVTGITYWLHGCIRVGLQPEEIKDGKVTEAVWFDQSQLVVVDEGVHQPMLLTVGPAIRRETRRSNGGPSREARSFSRR